MFSIPEHQDYCAGVRAGTSHHLDGTWIHASVGGQLSGVHSG